MSTDPTSPHHWRLLFGSLCLSAGHGVFLLIAVLQVGLPPGVQSQRGLATTGAILWFIGAIPLALVALLAREKIEAMAPGPRRLLTLLTAGTTLGVFALYAVIMQIAN